MESLQTNAPQPSQLTYRNNMLKITEPTYIEMNGSGELKYVSASKQEGNRLKVKHLIVIQGAGTNSRIQEFQNNGFTISNPITLGERKAAVMNELKARYYPTEGEVTFGATTVSVTSELDTLRANLAQRENELRQLVATLNTINQSINGDIVALREGLTNLKTTLERTDQNDKGPYAKIDGIRRYEQIGKYSGTSSISSIINKQSSLVKNANSFIESANDDIQKLNKMLYSVRIFDSELKNIPLFEHSFYNAQFSDLKNPSFEDTIKNACTTLMNSIQAFLDNAENKAIFTRISGNIAKLRNINTVLTELNITTP